MKNFCNWQGGPNIPCGGPPGQMGPMGPNGPNGLSAYEIAVEEGFMGTEAAWLASLVGPTGPTEQSIYAQYRT